MAPSLPMLSCELSVSVKENPDRKIIKNMKFSIKDFFIFLCGDIETVQTMEILLCIKRILDMNFSKYLLFSAVTWINLN